MSNWLQKEMKLKSVIGTALVSLVFGLAPTLVVITSKDK